MKLLIPIVFTLISCATKSQISHNKWTPINNSEAILEKEDINQEYQISVKVLDTSSNLPPDLLSFSQSFDVKSILSYVNYTNASNETVEKIELRFGTINIPIIRNQDSTYRLQFDKADFYVELKGLEEEWFDIGASSLEVNSIGKDNIEVTTTRRLKGGSHSNEWIRLSISINKININSRMSNNFVMRDQITSRTLNIGYFSTAIALPHLTHDKIHHFPLPTETEKIIYFLEDFPQNLQQPSIDTIKLWNKAFGYEAIDVKIATGQTIWGNRNYNVIKWKDLKDSGILGIANQRYTFPTGQIYSTHVQINSYYYNSIKDRIKLNFKHLQRINDIKLRIGSTDLNQHPQEPIVPFGDFRKLKDPDKAVERYYLETILHEVGHTLGLTHNFKGSISNSENKEINSIMDYVPRYIRQTIDPVIGPYDIAAIRWGYFGEKPEVLHPFCEESTLRKDWQCNIGDINDPLDYLKSSLTDQIKYFRTLDIKIESQQEVEILMTQIQGTIDLYYKLIFLKLPESHQAQLKEIKLLWQKLWNLELQGVQQANLLKIKNNIQEYLNCMDENTFEKSYMCEQ